MRHYLITAAYIVRYNSHKKLCSALVKYYNHPLDSETANCLLRTDYPFITVAVDAISLRHAKLIAKAALMKEMIPEIND